MKLQDLIDVELLIRHDPSLRAIVETRREELPHRINLAWEGFLPKLKPALREPE